MKNLLIIIILCLISNACLAGEKIPVSVIKVIDGDTILVNYNNKSELIRLIGIDCYETYLNNRAYKQA